jgi:hypothetical protein
MPSRRFSAAAGVFLSAGMLFAAPDAPDANEPQNDVKDTPPMAHVKPLVKWTFDADEPGTWTGMKKVEPQGPQKPTYPAFAAGNKAASFSGKDSFITVKESDVPGVNLRFGLGDPITIEAWVNVEEIKDGSYCYLIGKGRSKNKAFEPENQNWALRLKGEGGEARPAFLFRTVSEKFDSQKDYRRWVAAEGFTPNSGWHHVAVTFHFGNGDSLRGYVDGKEVKGTWDMGGKSSLAPVNDADDVVIGTGNGGGAGNSLKGWLDEVAVYREVLPESLLAQRYQFLPPPPAVDVTKLPAGRVLVQICEKGVPEKNAWPAIAPQATETYTEEAFAFVEVPQKYVDTGVRGDRANPFVFRAAATVTLPPGRHRLLLRGRGSSHLNVDGKQILTTPFPKPDPGGHGYVKEQEEYLDLGPEFRFSPPGNQEAWCEFETKGGEHIFVMETMVGGMVGSKSKRRPELGETVVAWSREGSESWALLTPGGSTLPYTDAAWPAYEAAQHARLDAMNAASREKQRAQHAAFWEGRRRAAQEWLAATPEVKVPAPAKRYPDANAIDRFLGAKIASVLAQNDASHKGSVDFFRDVLPVLETKCFDCHRGGKAKGGLKLDALAEALKGGDSGPAITAGQPDKSEMIARVTSDDVEAVMPPKGGPLPKEQIEVLRKWIAEGANWPEFKADNVTVTPLTDDLAFLRRVTLDTVGVVPSLAEIEEFTNDTSPNKRAKAIGRLLNDPRWADNWMGYWQDVLAENPNMLNPTLNNTGPFRWWIYESLLDNKPMDLFVTELLRMKGSERFGGPAGFGVASQNDVPMAAKGTIVSTAFLGVEMKCARCHDSPAHKSTQEDLFQLAAMLNTKPVEVVPTSSVSAEKLTAGGRKPLISVTLKTGTKVEPKWPFDEFCADALGEKLAQDAKDQRDRLAALVTAPQNERFAQVIANRVWKRFMGRGIVEPVDDWEKGRPSHPELLRWLGRELVRSGYDAKHIARIILNSHAYQRATDPSLTTPSPLFAAPAPRRLGAEQIVDSLFAATGKPFALEEVSLDIDGRRDLGNSISLGQPRRCWMLTSTSNERDRPSLALPRIQAIADVLSAFGWRGARQDPTSVRETAPNALQPAIMSNGTMSVWLTRLSDDHGITQLALQKQSVDQLVDTLYLRLLTRKPTSEERARTIEHLTPGYESRIRRPAAASQPSTARRPAKYVSWSNHLDPEATLVRQEQEIAARRGDPPTERLDAGWRQRLEDVLWAMLNAPEWVFAP